ncbi:MAG: hypothetical protein M3N43_14310 [Actinomycetota bacterium]|nr:hypothetical protein [Actinomycetota bacterium]
MYRLAELSDGRRKSIGWGLLGLGFVTLVVAVLLIHYSSLPPEIDAGAFDWVPRGSIWKGIGYLIAFGASQMLVVGAFFVWVLNQKMTWARAVFAAFATWLELVIIFGMVPSEWLNFAQTDLDWSSQRVSLVIPPWLVLGNQVEISYAVIKDSISMGYHIVMLVAAPVFALQLQKMKHGAPVSADKPESRSPYGRPLVKGGA